VIKEAISKLVEGNSLAMGEAESVMDEIMEGVATPAQLGAFLIALRIKGESAEEIAGLATAMRARAIRVRAAEPVLDIVGTGGDGLNTFNISTAAALVTAAAGVKVAKHGNRAASSRCGSADVLEKLGVKLDLTAEEVQKCIQEVGIGFMFAPAFHPAMKHAAPTRREIAVRTVFNLLGPLTNPAFAEYQVIGAPSQSLAEKIVFALVRMKAKRALVVQAENGMDELSISGVSYYWEILDGNLISAKTQVTPEMIGLKRAGLDTIQGGSADENARIILDIFRGRQGPQREVVALNAAAGLVAANKVDNLREGVAIALATIDSGQALSKVYQLAELTRKLGASRQ
jgi:anthranilate phosphoribosyltransferase